MATEINSRIILAKNIKMDRDYNNVLNYTQTQMVSLCEANAVASSSNYQFLRTNEPIYVSFSYELCLQANYIAFQNPSYSNKWFFAWIDEVNYKGDNNTEIRYTIDSWSTFYSDWSVSPCLVVREHVNDDTRGSNTVEENLDVGEIVQTGSTENVGTLAGTPWVVILSSYNPQSQSQFAGITVYDKNVYGYQAFVFPFSTSLQYGGLTGVFAFIQRCNLDGHIEDINSIFLVPNSTFTQSEMTEVSFTVGSDSYTGYTPPYTTEGSEFNSITTIPTTFGSYTPKNNKCLCYPYNFLRVTNNQGSVNNYRYEYFDNDLYGSSTVFAVQSAFSVGRKCKDSSFKL